MSAPARYGESSAGSSCGGAAFAPGSSRHHRRREWGRSTFWFCPRKVECPLFARRPIGNAPAVGPPASDRENCNRCRTPYLLAVGSGKRRGLQSPVWMGLHRTATPIPRWQTSAALQALPTRRQCHTAGPRPSPSRATPVMCRLGLAEVLHTKAPPRQRSFQFSCVPSNSFVGLMIAPSVVPCRNPHPTCARIDGHKTTVVPGGGEATRLLIEAKIPRC